MDILVQAGANLGGTDLDGGYALFAWGKAMQSGDEASARIWEKTGLTLKAQLQENELKVS